VLTLKQESIHQDGARKAEAVTLDSFRNKDQISYRINHQLFRKVTENKIVVLATKYCEFIEIKEKAVDHIIRRK
jgi:hypothetical protein